MSLLVHNDLHLFSCSHVGSEKIIQHCHLLVTLSNYLIIIQHCHLLVALSNYLIIIQHCHLLVTLELPNNFCQELMRSLDENIKSSCIKGLRILILKATAGFGLAAATVQTSTRHCAFWTFTYNNWGTEVHDINLLSSLTSFKVKNIHLLSYVCPESGQDRHKPWTGCLLTQSSNTVNQISFVTFCTRAHARTCTHTHARNALPVFRGILPKMCP